MSSFFVFGQDTRLHRGGEKKEPTGGIEPPTFRLQSECSTTKLSRPPCTDCRQLRNIAAGDQKSTACGDRTRDQSIKSRTLYLTELRRPVFHRDLSEGDWSSGMIPASGAGGREFDSRITPF